MPILAKECDIFPESLLDEAAEKHENFLDQTPEDTPATRQWWVIYTKARQEKALARELLKREISFYLPLVPKTAVYRRQSVNSYHPLFTGYVFLLGTGEQRTSALATNRVSRALPVGEPERLIHDLRQLRRLIASEAPLTVESRLIPGQRVRVKHGPLSGLEGTVVIRRGRARLLVRVDFLQQGASVEIDDFLLEPAG